MYRATLADLLLTAACFVPPTFQAVIPRSTMRIVYQFPNKGTWIENVATRSNGDLLVTLLSAPELHSISPLSNDPTQTLIHSFAGTPGITSLLGITELEDDVFAFVAGNATQPGSWSIWQADLRRSGHKHGKASVSKIADVPTGNLLNGMTKLKERTVLIADSMAGNVIKLDTGTGKSEVILDDVTMKPTAIPRFISGINGIKLLGDHFYYTNSFTGKLHRIRIDLESGKAIGAAETVASDLVDNDDFAILENGTAFVVRDNYNVVERVEPDGTHKIFAGSIDSSGMAGPTAATIGRTARDRNVLYVVTNGGMRAPVGGEVVPGRVVAISYE
ncbi:uncharacterized protein EI97DRAFT_494852 [Westerdykella ornata]|uniref:Calcium-dependent phosphotriesterase n=1 Tax=Westerdykella ornata TaxID=318751 RepID=A0A6A6JK40_WESOR|nr:uncharacterized protein EI97DRAFT_494852 [Westerdykella ornata]KAF2275249.1 hypothetical protein EI97DRAFT_494852 [Westerdykella ornata]